jgi:hypothetical protein
MSSINKTQGLVCPNCAGIVPVPEGARVVECPFCHFSSLVQGERGVYRWQVRNKVVRDKAVETVRGFWRGFNKARDLPREAKIKDVFLVYLPYWRLHAFVVGWIFGRVRKDKDETKPVEVEIFQEMAWNDAALNVAEYGVHSVAISADNLEPYDEELLRNEALVFEPTESRTEAMSEAEQHFIYRARNLRSLTSRFFEHYEFLNPRFSTVYYPLWVVRYEYKKRNYQTVVDGVSNKLLYGKAPGNTIYRALMLVVGLALGNFILVNGFILGVLGLSVAGDDEAGAFLLIPLAIGVGLIGFGYRAFRYGEEVEHIEGSSRKAHAGEGSTDLGEMMQSGMTFFEDMAQMAEFESAKGKKKKKR